MTSTNHMRPTANALARPLATALAAALALVGAAAAPAHAASNAQGHFEFDYSPVELSTTSGAKIVLARLQGEVTDYCDEALARRSLDSTPAQMRCQRTLMGQSLRKIGSPELSAMARNLSPRAIS